MLLFYTFLIDFKNILITVTPNPNPQPPKGRGQGYCNQACLPVCICLSLPDYELDMFPKVDIFPQGGLRSRSRMSLKNIFFNFLKYFVLIAHKKFQSLKSVYKRRRRCVAGS